MSKYKIGDLFIDSQNNKYFITTITNEDVWFVKYVNRSNTIDYDGRYDKVVFDYMVETNKFFYDTEAAKVLYGNQ